MTSDSTAVQEPGLAEQPTPAAELKLAVGPATAGGTVPPGDAHHFITSFGILGSAVTGIAGAVLTLRIASGVLSLRITSGLTVLALAELVLALAAAVLIAGCGRARDKNRAEGHAASGPPAAAPTAPGGEGGIMTS